MPAMVNGWTIKENVGWACSYVSSEHPDWTIYEQPNGYMVWQYFHFKGRAETFAEAIAIADGGEAR